MGIMDMSRRRFAQLSGLAGAAALAGLGLPSNAEAAEAAPVDPEFPVSGRGRKLEATYDPKTDDLKINDEVIVRYSNCVGCYAMCGVRLKLDRESREILAQGGNPYNPCNAYPVLPFDEPLTEAYRTMTQSPTKQTGAATCCGRSLGALDVYLNSYRITTPLKRAGKRGEGKWQPISWDQLIDEVVEGGKLFKDIGEDREIEGFRAVRDFDTPLVPDAPEFGSKANGLIYCGGRTDGRGQTSTRFLSMYGSANKYSHHSSCYGAKGVYPYQSGDGDDLGIDAEFNEYAIWMGTFPGANGGSVMSDLKRVASTIENKQAKIVVFDPNLGNGVVTPAQDNAVWYPIKPATNSALTMGMIRWIIDNKKYNEDFMSAPNLPQAVKLGFNACTNATHLVIVDEQHPNYRHMMHPEDAGLPESEKENAFEEQYVCIDAATKQPAVSLDSDKGLMEWEGEVNGVKVRTAYLFIKDSAHAHTIEEYSQACDVPVEVIEDVASEFVAHGTKSSVNGAGGVTSANGTDATSCFSTLAGLTGALCMKGSLISTFVGVVGPGNGDRYLLSKAEGMPKDKPDARIDRTGFAWEDTSEYARRIAAGEKNPKPLLPWYPGGVGTSDNQMVLSLANGYPHKAKILLTWQCNPIKATPGAMRDEVMEAFKDPDIIPLAICCDVVEGTFAHMADYIVPDTMYREHFGISQHAAWWGHKGNFLQWPMVEPKSMKLDDGRHASFDAFLCDVGRKLELPGYGDKALLSATGELAPYNDACDYYVKALANIAYEDGIIDDLSDEEIKMQALDTLPDAWKKAVAAEEWPKVQRLLSRGCRTWPEADTFDAQGRQTYSGAYMVNFYSEERGSVKNHYTGEFYEGALGWHEEVFSDGTPIADVYSRDEYPFAAASHKPYFRCVTMLSDSALLRELSPHNYLEINIEDARELGIEDGETVQAINPSGDVMEGVAMLRGGTARGTIGISFGYTQDAYGSTDLTVGDETIPGNPDIDTGVQLCQMLDPQVGEGGILAFSDPEASTPGRNGGMFKLVVPSV